jgi:hypothetical protein
MSSIPVIPWPTQAYPQTPPPPLVSELDRLRLELAANRATLASYASALAEAQAELREWRGEGVMVEPGCEHIPLTLDGDCAVLVEFKRTPAVPADFDDPGDPEEIDICCAYVNKTWVDASEFDAAVLGRWIEQIRSAA